MKISEYPLDELQEVTRRGALVRLARVPQQVGIDGPDDYMIQRHEPAKFFLG